MAVTIKKIAKDLNLAVSTVSKALRDSHEISAETKARVFEYAARMDYSPNPYASSLKGRRSGNIAVVVPEVSDSFFSEAINGIEEIAKEKGYHVMIYLTHEDETLEQSIIHDLRNGRVDGILISVVAGDSKANHLRDLKVPLVFFDRIKEEIPATTVVTNDFESAYQAVQHLVNGGGKCIAFLSTFGDLAIIKQRQAGFQKAVQDSGLESGKCSVVPCTNSESENLNIIRQLLTAESKPDAIIGSVEKVTMQAYAVCHRLGLRIPEDVKIIGFSHSQVAALLKPSLTTITQPAHDMGKTAATLLFKALKKRREDLVAEKIVIPSVLIVRDSTR